MAILIQFLTYIKLDMAIFKWERVQQQQLDVFDSKRGNFRDARFKLTPKLCLFTLTKGPGKVGVIFSPSRWVDAEALTHFLGNLAQFLWDFWLAVITTDQEIPLLQWFLRWQFIRIWSGFSLQMIIVIDLKIPSQVMMIDHVGLNGYHFMKCQLFIRPNG